jgi:hypothetical protein
VNTKTSHYLLSKVYRAREALEHEHPEEASKWKEKHPQYDPARGGLPDSDAESAKPGDKRESNPQ